MDLFAKGHLLKELESERVSEVQRRVNNYTDDEILNWPLQDLISSIALTIDSFNIEIDRVTTTHSSTGLSPAEYGYSPDGALGEAYKLHFPYTGPKGYIEYNPLSSLPDSFLKGEIKDDEIIVVLKGWEINEEELKQWSEMVQSTVSECAAALNEIIKNTNALIVCKIEKAVQARKNKILSRIKKSESLKVPLKRYEVQPTTFEVPIRRIIKPLKTCSVENFEPDPTIAFEEYEHILQVCSNMAVVMERSPSVFQEIREEDLRIHFLVQLNGHYGGFATGETFNMSGKTDVLIRAPGLQGNLFIAECKFWTGEKDFSEAIDQLLKYVTWRDTKTAIILFVRGKNFSRILNKADSTCKLHANYKRNDENVKVSESAFRFVFRNANDDTKEFLLALLCFHIPSASS
ncbi:MAG: hypothetical protein K2X81_28365 [Candidatus Obscuribacterales bacterium]|nr:hypothetical protein [Candidatus Obscuribacterales bacterium]